MKKKNLFLFFYLPLAGIVVIFFVLSSVNRRSIRTKVEELVNDQLYATAEILKVNISHFLYENYTANDIFELYSSEKNIYYLALLDESKQILGWVSRFEGYLPLSVKNIGEKEPWVIDSPVGKIFNLYIPFKVDGTKTFFLYLGYSLENLEEMITQSRRTFSIIFGVIVAVGIIFFLGIYRLQNHYLRKEREAEEEKKEKERYREISAFTSGVAHEIKNPLNSLSLLFELLQKKAPQELQEDISLGKKEVHKVSRIIDQFSSTQKSLKLSKEKIFLAEFIQDILDSLYLDQGKIQIQYHETGPIILEADKRLLSQALINLLKNSLDATEKGVITIRANQHRKTVFLTIQDPGHGIAKEDKPYIFFPFHSKKEKGMGVGLYLTKKIIEAHGGKIEFQSEQGQGATFSMQIPGGKHV